jgi:hypothetical protein
MQVIVSKCLLRLERREKGALEALDAVKPKDLAQIASTLMERSVMIKERVAPTPDKIYEMSEDELMAELTGKKGGATPKTAQEFMSEKADTSVSANEENSEKNENEKMIEKSICYGTAKNKNFENFKKNAENFKTEKLKKVLKIQ